MSTHSTIAMQYPDGRVRAISAFWNGHPLQNGAVLLKHYSNPWRLDQLLRLGALSVIRRKIGKAHPYDYKLDPATTPNEMALWDTWTLAKHRDGGEPLCIMDFKDLDHYFNELDHEAFNYLYRFSTGWTYRLYDGTQDFLLLAKLENEGLSV